MRLDLFPSRILLFVSIFCGLAATQAQAQSTLIPLTTRRDMVFDHAGNYLYISTSDGFVQRYNLTTKQIDNSYNLGGSLNAIDIAQDDSFILAAQNDLTPNGEFSFQRVNLSTGEIININHIADAMRQESGAWDVAIASNGRAFATTHGAFSSLMYQIDLATNQLTVRDQTHNGFLGIRGSTNIVRNADGTRLYFLQCGAAAFSYSSVNDTFGVDGQSDPGVACGSSGAVSRDGTLLATQNASRYGGTLDSAPELNFIHSFYQFSGGVAFDAKQDIVYSVDSYADKIFAFDTNTFAEVFEMDIGEDVGNDARPLVASNDGHYLALHTTSGVRLFAIPNPPYSAPPSQLQGTPSGMVFDHASNYLYVTTADGFVLKFSIPAGQLERTYNVGGWLWGIDIAADDSYVIVAQAFPGVAQGAFQKVDLATGQITNYGYPLVRGEAGAYDLAITSNGHLFGSTSGDFDPVRDINLATGAIVPRMPWSPGGLRRQVQIEHSADRNRLYFLELESGQHFTYDAVSDTFTPNQMSGSSGIQYANIGVNRNGSLLVTRDTPEALLSAPDFTPGHAFAGIDSGVAFDPVKDTLYGIASNSDEIVAYDTNTFAEQKRMWLGEDIPSFGEKFDVGMMIASSDGRYLALYTPTAIDLIDLQNPPPPRPNYTISLNAFPSTGGTVDGGGTFPIGTSVTAKATPATGYNFANWTENGHVVSTSQWYTFNASANRALVANFIAFPTVSISASPTKIRKTGSATLTVSATTVNPSQPVLINYYTSGSAFPGTDYTLTGAINSIQITIAPGNSSAIVNLKSVTTKTKGSEVVNVVLMGGAGYNVAVPTKKIKTPGQATVTIQNK